MKKHQLFLCLVVIAFTGCASQVMKSYIGRPVTDVMLDQGMPSGAFDLNSEIRAFVWTKNSTSYFPGYSTTSGTTVGNQIFLNTYSSPGYVATNSCNYVLYARRNHLPQDGPAGWTVSGFKEPSFLCE